MSHKLSMHNMRSMAQKYGGRCLSKSYKNAQKALSWMCKKKHVFKATPNSVQQGHWCPCCVGRGKTIADMNKLAKKMGGKCLSNKYRGVDEKLQWQCQKGHKWWQKPAHIYNGHWCPYCSGNARLNIRTMQAIAHARGGSCLSIKYINAQSDLLWECRFSHIWKATPNRIQQGSWCPECSSMLREKMCRLILEKLLHAKFVKTKPKWLLNSKGNRMELDGYNKSLHIAFEHQGKQHYLFNKLFHRERSFTQQKRDDLLKRRLCKKHKVALIIIPYYIKAENIEAHIKKRLISNKIAYSRKKIDLSSLLANTYSPDIIKELNNIAKQRGGKCLSKTYLGGHTKIRWRCKDGYEWEAAPSDIKAGKWCPHCAGRPKILIKDIFRLALIRSGKCTSKKYINARAKLKWKCKKGHAWRASYDNVKRGTWCPYCVGKKKWEKKK